MKSSKYKKYIDPLRMNRLKGRMLRLPPPEGKSREILLIYGHHASLERMFGLAEVLNEYGGVTMPDLPGFGGMESFYKIQKKPTLDNYADYLASFLKLFYKRRRVTIVAMSFSVPLVVRMLQKNPELARKVDAVVSISGFVHREDFVFTRTEYWGLRALSGIFSQKLPAAFMKTFVLRSPPIRLAYKLVRDKHKKMKDAANEAELNRRIDFEIQLWKVNDLRTRMSTMEMMLTMDLLAHGSKVNVPVYHVTAKADRYFNNEIVQQHLNVIFPKVEVIKSKMANHAPTIIADAKEAAPYVPKRLRTILARG